jgi:LPPG:FO 2-phospho-L-lactate transferase
MRWRGVPVSNQGIAAIYEGLIDGLVCDEPLDWPPTLTTDLLMRDAASRRRLAAETLAFAAGLAPDTRRRTPVTK